MLNKTGKRTSLFDHECGEPRVTSQLPEEQSKARGSGPRKHHSRVNWRNFPVTTDRGRRRAAGGPARPPAETGLPLPPTSPKFGTPGQFAIDELGGAADPDQNTYFPRLMHAQLSPTSPRAARAFPSFHSRRMFLALHSARTTCLPSSV